MRVLVTGGSGFVGQAVIAALTAAGHDVRALARSDAAGRAVAAAGATATPGGLAPAAGLDAALAGCDAVVHAAGVVRMWGHDAAMRALHVDGTAALLAAARAAGVRRFVAIGAASVVAGPDAPPSADDATPLPAVAVGSYSQTKAAAERRVRAADAPGFATIVLRPPWIWGPGNPALPRLAAMARAGQWRWIDEGDYPVATCHVANVAAAAVAALTAGRGGEAYFITDGGDRTMRRFVTDMLATQRVDPGTRSLPRAAAWALAAALETVWRGLRRRGEPPLTRAAVAMIGTGLRIDDRRARAELGYAPPVAYEDGMAGLLPRPARTA